ncbi:MAG: nucleotidyltransferase domain-containing protein [Candidatus Omnitrophica bacterium]|nr:nucleotidyltransferase domain-containing protein [Candidatus Omnitrophota bacterium]
MISEKDKKIIRKLSEKYHVRKVLLFGSSLDPAKEGRDIDLAVEGIDSRKFFKYYGDLMFGLSKPVDLIDLSDESKFVALVRRDGVQIYG